MNVLILDDHPLFRRGLKFLLDNLSELIEVVEAGSYDEALKYAKSGIDLILLDLKMPGVNGMDALADLSGRFHVPIVVLSGEDTPQHIRQAIGRGASGFIPKASSPEILVAALKLILAGGVYIPPESMQQQWVDCRQTAAQSKDPGVLVDSLSERQRQVLHRAVQGKANKIIARELCISEGTVKAHLSSAYRSLGVKNRTEAVLVMARLDQGACSLQ